MQDSSVRNQSHGGTDREDCKADIAYFHPADDVRNSPDQQESDRDRQEAGLADPDDRFHVGSQVPRNGRQPHYDDPGINAGHEGAYSSDAEGNPLVVHRG